MRFLTNRKDVSTMIWNCHFSNIICSFKLYVFVMIIIIIIANGCSREFTSETIKIDPEYVIALVWWFEFITFPYAIVFPFGMVISELKLIILVIYPCRYNRIEMSLRKALSSDAILFILNLGAANNREFLLNCFID